MPDNVDAERLMLAGDGHVIIKDAASTRQCLQVAVFLMFADRCQVCVALLLTFCQALVLFVQLRLQLQQ